MSRGGMQNRMEEAEKVAALDALRRVKASGYFETAPKLEAFLSYVVDQAIEGGTEVDAYAIAVNALDRPESFDPRSDPVVRVFAGRLRTALAEYYDGPGKRDPLRITIPKGTYRPAFERLPNGFAAGGGVARERQDRSRNRLRGIALAALGAAVVVAAGHTFYASMRESTPRDTAPETRVVPTHESAMAFPMVEIGPFDVRDDLARSDLMTGIRQQIVMDLSQFKTLRIRDRPTGPDVAETLKRSDFLVDGRLVKSGGRDMLRIAVRETASSEVIWRQMLAVPENDAEYQDLLLTAVRAIAPRLAGVSGIVQSDAIRRLEARRDKLANTETSDYECVVKFYAFGQRRPLGSEEAVRQCLETLTSQGSRDSMVWAFWSLMKYMDWVRYVDDGSTTVLRESLRAAREAIELDPANANAHEFAAMTYAAMGEPEAAKTSFEHALDLNPSKPDFYVHYGSFFIQLGDWEKGVELVRRGIELSPSPPGWMYLPLTMDAFRRDDFAEALRIARLIVESGDRRGYMPALAAAIALDDREETERFLAAYRGEISASSHAVLRQFAKVYADPVLVAKYRDMLARVLPL